MLVSEMIEWLKTQDQGAIVEVLVHTSGTEYYDQGGNVSREDFDPSPYYEENCTFGKHWEYTDLRGNHLITEDRQSYNKRYLLIGGQE